jgi:hypothetical protein
MNGEEAKDIVHEQKKNDEIRRFFPDCLVKIISDYGWVYQLCAQCKNLHPYSLTCFQCMKENVILTYETKGKIFYSPVTGISMEGLERAENDEDAIVLKYVSRFTHIVTYGCRAHGCKSIRCKPRHGTHGPHKQLCYKKGEMNPGPQIWWEAHFYCC